MEQQQTIDNFLYYNGGEYNEYEDEEYETKTGGGGGSQIKTVDNQIWNTFLQNVGLHGNKQGHKKTVRFHSGGGAGISRKNIKIK